MIKYLRSPNLVVLTLGGACLFLLGLIYWEWTASSARTVVASVTTSGAAADLSLPTPPIFAAPPLQSLSDFIDRPIFTPTRRPPPPVTVAASAAPAPVAPPPPLPKFTLLGTVTAAEWRGALLRTPAGKVVSVSEGDTVEGWQLSSVFEDRLVFEAGSNKQELLFPVQQGSKGPSKASITELSPASPSLGRLSQ